MVWQGVVQSLAPLVGGSVYLWWHHRRQPAVEGETNWLSPIGSNGVRLAVLVAMLMWVVPAGALLAVPLALGISLLSPAARAEWTDHRRVRIAAVSVAVLFLGVTGFLPVEEPVAPEAWGQPLFTENPHAPLYPTSQQYTWLTSDVVVLQSVSVRLPHQPGGTLRARGFGRLDDRGGHFRRRLRAGEAHRQRARRRDRGCSGR